MYLEEGNGGVFDELKCFLPGAFDRRPYHEIAARLAKSEEAVKMAVSRLRRKYGRVLRGTVSRTVMSPAEVEDELSYLCTLLGE